MSDLRKKMAETLALGLKRKTLTLCSKWAQNCIVMGKPFAGPLDFRYHRWTEEMHDSESPMNVGQKSAQMGFTVAMMHRSFHKIDQLRESVLYLLPSKTPDATDFSATKFDPALELSPHLENLFSDVKNTGTKRAGSAILYIRGSNSRKGLKSISVSLVVCDEYDEMPEHTVPLAQERMSGQPKKQLWLISTPRFPGQGINKEFLDSTMEHFHFDCPSCSRQIELKHENLVITSDDLHDPKIKDSYVKCLECGSIIFDSSETPEEYAEHKADLLQNGIWVPHGHKDFDKRGFYVNQLYSPTIMPVDLAKAYLQSLTNKSKEQEYHNSKMGDAHEVEGARITQDAIENCFSKSGRRKSSNNQFSGRLITMGVDVGRWLHYEITAWDVIKMGNDINIMSRAILLDEGKKLNFNELDGLMRAFQIHMAVVDIQPETRQALDFAKRFWGHVKLCRYGKGLTDNTMIVEDSNKFVITVDRTSWLDMSLGRIHNQTIDLPVDISLEYRAHLCNIGRIYQEDKDGNQIGKYINNGDDHFAHARNYNEIALPLAAAFQTNSDIGAFL